MVLKADSIIGTGHLMRVKSLLRYFKEQRLILCSESLSEELTPLCSEYDEIIRAPLDELPLKILEHRPQLVLVDNYFIDASFESLLYPHTKVAVIDDLANRPHCCHLLFDQYIMRTREEYLPLVPDGCRLCLGRDYNFVKPEFSELKRVPPADGIPRVLVNFGGSDPVHGCLITLKSILSGSLNSRYAFTIISGMSNPDHEQIVEIARGQERLSVIRHSYDMPDVFAHHDLSIGACGGTFQERTVAGLCGINIEIADNQKGVCDSIVRKFDIGECLEVSDLKSPGKIDESLLRVIRRKAEYERNCRNLFSGKGLVNMAEALCSFLEE